MLSRDPPARIVREKLSTPKALHTNSVWVQTVSRRRPLGGSDRSR